MAREEVVGYSLKALRSEGGCIAGSGVVHDRLGIEAERIAKAEWKIPLQPFDCFPLAQMSLLLLLLQG